MCLILENKEDQIRKVAKRNITVYKVLQNSFRSLFYTYYYTLGELNIGTLKNNNNHVHVGFHSFRFLKDARQYRFSSEIIVKCVIPKGSNYYLGIMSTGSRLRNYASDQIIVKEIIKCLN